MDINTQLIEAIFEFSRNLKGEMSYDCHIMHLSMLQLQVLLHLKHSPASQMSEIATKFHIELPSATSLINTLKKAKLVVRKTDEKDRRLVRISLTQSGEDMLTDAMKERNKKVSTTLQHLSQEDKITLLSILQKLIVKMEVKNEK